MKLKWLETGSNNKTKRISIQRHFDTKVKKMEQ
jgi:hypothetical protein